MKVVSVGIFKIELSTDAYPIWARLSVNGVDVAALHHDSLRDLEYAVSRAMVIARCALPPDFKDEV
jgi:hypothetical protein